jgi:TolA-binding protein
MSAPLLLVAAIAALDGGAPTGQARFEAATAREAQGDYAGAAADLEALARELPNDAFADDALFEAAMLAEERLSDPARAARLFDEVARRWPQSRLARRARGRADFLRGSLATGEGPLREYQAILSAAPSRPPAESAARMERLLASHPDFALADRALYWLGSSYAEQRRWDEAMARFADVERRFPRSDWAARAMKARGDLLLARRHPYEARAVFTELAGAADPTARAAGAEGLENVTRALRRLVLAALALGYLIAFFVAHAWRLGAAGLRRVPTELLYYAPVALVFVIAGETENSAIGWCTLAIAVGGGLVIWLTGNLAQSETRARLLRATATALAVLCIVVVAVQATGLTDLVVETLRAGPER